jgi:hypothetical protein
MDKGYLHMHENFRLEHHAPERLLKLRIDHCEVRLLSHRVLDDET